MEPIISLHSKYSPSKLPRILECPGSVQLTETVIDSQGLASPGAIEGTLLHYITEQCLNAYENTVPESLITKYSLNTEQHEAVQEVLDWVTITKASYSDKEAYDLVEAKVSLSGFEEPFACAELGDVEGTMDYALVLPAHKTLICADWKFGTGVEVFADTPQLKAYCLGKLKNMSFAKHFDTVKAVIVQPRLHTENKVKEIVYSIDDLLSWLKGTLVPALEKAQLRFPPFNPSKSTCQWCPAAQLCKARRLDNINTAKKVFLLHSHLPNITDLNELRKLLDKAPDLIKYINDLKAFAAQHIKKGLEFPGYKLVSGRVSRQWADVDKTLSVLKEQGISEEELQIYKLMSPAQVEKKWGKAIKSLPEFQELIVKTEGNPSLVKDSNKKPALSFKTAEQVFQD